MDQRHAPARAGKNLSDGFFPLADDALQEYE